MFITCIHIESDIHLIIFNHMSSLKIMPTYNIPSSSYLRLFVFRSSHNILLDVHILQC